MFVTTEQEKRTLETAMEECRRRLDIARAEGDELARDLAQSDLNAMLDKWSELNARTD